MSKRETALNYPLVGITPKDVIAFGRRRWQKPTVDEANSWLAQHRILRVELVEGRTCCTHDGEYFLPDGGRRSPASMRSHAEAS